MESFSNEEYLSTKSRDELKLQCDHCEKEFLRTKKEIQKARRLNRPHYCSPKCKNERHTVKEKVSCKNCGEPLVNSRSKYCCSKCAGEHKKEQNIEKWKSDPSFGHTGASVQLKPFVRSYMAKKANHKCSKCGWSVVHPVTGRPPLEINHINGNPLDCNEGNLEVLCPNCHALTSNYRALNKNSPRKR